MSPSHRPSLSLKDRGPGSYSFAVQFKHGLGEIVDYLEIEADDLIYEMELAASRRVDELMDKRRQRGRSR